MLRSKWFRFISILMILVLVGMAIPRGYSYANENEDTENESSKESGESEQSDEEKQRIEEINNNIREKQEQIKAAEQEKEKIKGQLTDIKNVVNSLKNNKKNLEDYVVKLDKELSGVQDKIAELKSLINHKEKEIWEAEVDLEEATDIQKAQYDAMKKRIKFMYEKGDTFYLSLLFESSSFADMINKADYAEMMSKYDNSKLKEYQDTCLYIETCKNELEADKEVLELAKAQVDEEESNLEQLITAKENEINAATSNINNKEAAAREIEEDLAAQTAVITALEKAVAEELAKLESGGDSITYDGGMFTWPAPSYIRISDDYGNRIHPILGTQQFHSGIDMAAPGGSPILAAYGGEVVSADYNSSMGNYVMINHGNGLYTVYMHASALYVSKGQYVSKGSKIAAVGTTGRSTGNHLHFSVRKDGSYVNPWPYLGR